MKIDCGPDWEEYQAYHENWHPWFAWYPVMVKSHDCRWLETVERKGLHLTFVSTIVGRGTWDWEYRAITKEQR